MKTLVGNGLILPGANLVPKGFVNSLVKGTTNGLARSLIKVSTEQENGENYSHGALIRHLEYRGQPFRGHRQSCWDHW
jgi:hypothetical protein